MVGLWVLEIEGWRCGGTCNRRCVLAARKVSCPRRVDARRIAGPAAVHLVGVRIRRQQGRARRAKPSPRPAYKTRGTKHLRLRKVIATTIVNTRYYEGVYKRIFQSYDLIRNRIKKGRGASLLMY